MSIDRRTRARLKAPAMSTHPAPRHLTGGSGRVGDWVELGPADPEIHKSVPARCSQSSGPIGV